MRSIAIALTLMFAGTLFVAGSAEARQNSYRGVGGSNETWKGVAQNPWQNPNCYIYSAKIKWYVWRCGPPYPEGFAKPGDQ